MPSTRLPLFHETASSFFFIDNYLDNATFAEMCPKLMVCGWLRHPHTINFGVSSFRVRECDLETCPMDIQALFEKSSRNHSHLCPRQILGVRLGLAGMHTLGFNAPPGKKRLLVITETDGCFADGLSAATECTVGHRTLRVEDYGKTAAVFADTQTGLSLRLAPMMDIRQRAYAYAVNEPRHYFAQMQAYQVMPDVEMFTVTPVSLKTPIEAILSRPGVRVNCDVCGEEIMNEREIQQGGLTLCRACAGQAYYAVSAAVEQEQKVMA